MDHGKQKQKNKKKKKGFYQQKRELQHSHAVASADLLYNNNQAGFLVTEPESGIQTYNVTQSDIKDNVDIQTSTKVTLSVI